MNADNRYDNAIRDYLIDAAGSPDPGLHARSMDAVRSRRQRGQWFARVRDLVARSDGSGSRFAGRSGSLVRRSNSSALLVAVPTVAVLGLMVVALSPRTPIDGSGDAAGASIASPSSTPSPESTDESIAPSASRSTSIGQLVLERDALAIGRTITSDRFQPPVTFEVTPRMPGSPTEPDVCTAPYSSAGMIVLAHPKACVDTLRLIHPYAIECGLAAMPAHADALADAILERLGKYAVDRGSVSDSPVVQADLFAYPEIGRVVDITAGRAFDQAARDPDACRLLTGPRTADPVIEIRADIPARLIIVDVGDDLVVVWAGNGPDAATRAAALSRGYTGDLGHLTGLVRNLAFS
jgi:hypothetical protein